MRLVAGMILGVIFAAIVVFLMTRTAQTQFPAAALAIAEARPGYAPDPLAGMPLEAKIILVMGWFLAGLVGATTADLIAAKGLVGYLVAGAVVLYLLYVGLRMAHPVWMSLAGVFLPLFGAFIARKLTRTQLL